MAKKVLKKYFNFTYFDKFIFLSYLLLILFWIAFKHTPGISKSNESYLFKIAYNTNIIPFQFNPSTSISFIVKNLIFKAVILTPIAYFYLKYWDVKNYIKFISVMSTICVIFNLILLITLKGYFDTTDIIIELIGISIFYIMFSFKKLSVSDNRQ